MPEQLTPEQVNELLARIHADESDASTEPLPQEEIDQLLVGVGLSASGISEKSADTQYNNGIKYANGEGVPQDYAKAAEWFRKAAAQGHEKAKDFLAEAAATEAENRDRIKKLRNKIFNHPSDGHEYYILGGIPLACPERGILLFNGAGDKPGSKPDYSLWNIEFEDEGNFSIWPYDGSDSKDLIEQILENFVETAFEND